MKVGTGKGSGSLLGSKRGDDDENNGRGYNDSRSASSDFVQAIASMQDDMMMQMREELSRDVDALEATVDGLKEKVVQHEDEIAALKDCSTTMDGGVGAWMGAVVAAASWEGFHSIIAPHSLGVRDGDDATMSNEAPSTGENKSEEDTSVIVFEGGSDEEATSALTVGGSSTKKKKRRRKPQRKKNKKKRGYPGSKIPVAPGKEAVPVWGASATATLKHLPMAKRNFTNFKRFVVVCTTLLYVSGWIGQGYSSGGVSSESSGVSLSPYKPSHVQSRGEDEEFPTVSSNSMKQTERSAHVLDPVPDIVKKMPAALVNSQNKNYIAIEKIDNTQTTAPTRVDFPEKPSTITTLDPPAAATSNLRSALALQTTKRIDATPRTSPSLPISFSLRATTSAGPTSTTNPILLTTASTHPSENAQALQPDTRASLPSSTPATDSSPGNTSSRPSIIPLIAAEATTPKASSIFTATTPLPSAHPSSSIMSPSSSASESASLAPTPTPACEGANPLMCGCGSVLQNDYRGSINSTKTGYECVRWDSDLASENFGDMVGDYPDAGLDDNNFCRNPAGDGRAWCLTDESEGFEYCDVPYCFPSPMSCSDSNKNITSEELQSACAYHQCVDDYGYDSNDVVPLREEAKSICQCAHGTWDCEFGSKDCERDPALKEESECCKNKANDANWTPKEASCECSIKRYCEKGDGKKCIEFAEHCCGDDANECKCEYQTRACHLALESDSEELIYEYCKGIPEYCCRDDIIIGQDDNLGYSSKGGCMCDSFEAMCNDFPNSKADICTETPSTCCGDYNSHCKCDFFTYAVDNLGYNDKDNGADVYCLAARNILPNIDMAVESLQGIYDETGGDHWTNNTGWMTNASHCEWYGILCDDDGHVIELKLKSNNITGEYPSDFLSKLYKLKTLDLADNNLWGTMAGTYDPYDYNDDDWGSWAAIEIDRSIFFNLRELTHVDLSQNNLSGEVDVLFAPALEHVNFSHNNFTSINSFKTFKRSHGTLRICDLSFNSIQQEASKFLKNMPPNLEQLFLSNNLIERNLPKSLESLAYLRQFSIGFNRLSGELPDFSTSFPNLQELNFSNQKQDNNTGFTGTIPESFSNLPFLVTLNLAGNKLTHNIPPVLGNLAQLKVLDLSNNQLSKFIPKEFGKLKGTLEMIFLITCLKELFHQK